MRTVVVSRLQTIGLVVLDQAVTRPLPRCPRGTAFGLSIATYCYILELNDLLSCIYVSVVNCMSI